MKLVGGRPGAPPCGQVWVCLLEPTLPAACGGGLGAGWSSGGGANRSAQDGGAERLFPEMPCYTFDEAAGLFVYWGRNADLRLLSAAQMQQLPE